MASRTVQYQWMTDNTNAATVVGKSETLLDGTTTWNESFGRVTISVTSIDRATATRTVTITAPDGTGPQAAPVTAFLYDAQRGFLASKTYDDGKGPSYTYTSGMLTGYSLDYSRDALLRPA
ncbi:MAG: hypothetical protein KAI66_07265, partial [Lentisphaeria bacterium]|nr:hypothetical protein [Lentisphaeria bacterium]